MVQSKCTHMYTLFPRVIGMSLTLPPPPLSFTELPVNDIAGSFHINNASSLSSSEDEISAFLFKVETETEHIMSYRYIQKTAYNVHNVNTSSML